MSEFSVNVDGVTIVGEIYYPPKTHGVCPVLCLCHGIPAAESIPSDGGYPELARRFAKEGFVTCIFNFRGTGRSGGNLDLMGWTRDLDAVITRLARFPEIDKARIFVMGFSGGAAAATYAAARDSRISALVLCACPAEFSSLRLDRLLEQCRKIGTFRDRDFPSSPDKWRRNFLEVNPIQWVGKIAPRPLLILHGDKDELIKTAHARRLYEKAGEPKKLVLIPGGEHRLRISETAMEKALIWLKRQN